MRLNKYLAHAGIASRRKADELIKRGMVQVNGEVVLEMGHKVSRSDEVRYKGKVINPEQKVYILMNKPKDYITTTRDERGRKTVMRIIRSATNERVYPVGRLDRNTTGLLLLTNDGDLAQKLAHPSKEVKKIYEVRLDKPVSEQDLQKIADGLTLDDGPAPVDEVAYSQPGDKSEIGIGLHIGRNRIVRRIFEHLGYQVKSWTGSIMQALRKRTCHVENGATSQKKK